MILEQPFSFHLPKAAKRRNLEAPSEDEKETIEYDDDRRVFRMMPCSKNEAGQIYAFFKLCRDGNCQDYRQIASDFLRMTASYSKGIQEISDRCEGNAADYCRRCFRKPMFVNDRFTCNGASQACGDFSSFGDNGLLCEKSGQLKYAACDVSWDLYGYLESFDYDEILEDDGDSEWGTMLFCTTDFGTLSCSKTQKHKDCDGWCDKLVMAATWIGESADVPQQPRDPPAYGDQFCIPMHSEEEPIWEPIWTPTSSPTPKPTSSPTVQLVSEEGSQHRSPMLITLLAISGLIFSMGFVWQKRVSGVSSSRYSRLACDESSTKSPIIVQEFDYRSIEVSDLSLRDPDNGTIS